MNDPTTTLVAIATPAGRGGIGCVRLSGARALQIASVLFRAVSRGRRHADGRVRFGRFLDRDGRAIDHGYLVSFAAGSSFTGELTVELWSHGSPAILAELVEGAIGAGATPAGPGEFTYRALRQGRIDLARAEAIRDLVEARTLYQARVAFAQAEGAISRRLTPLKDDLEEWIARGEAAVEFVEESETHLASGAFRGAIDDSIRQCAALLAGFETGRIVRDGATLAIVGSPNAGKSSLFNRLLAQDRAIVTEIPGTTRDTLEEQFDLDGVPVRLVDTAGLRDVADPVESEGVRRAFVARAEADLVLLVLDGSRPHEPSGPEREPCGATTVVLNKSDLPCRLDAAAVPAGALRVSALTGEGIDALRAELRSHLLGSAPTEDPVVTNARQARALRQTLDALEAAAAARDSGLSEEFVLEHLKQARAHLGEITGEFDVEDLYDRVFSTFCIGK